jgi:hypothetical protein
MRNQQLSLVVFLMGLGFPYVATAQVITPVEQVIRQGSQTILPYPGGTIILEDPRERRAQPTPPADTEYDYWGASASKACKTPSGKRKVSTGEYTYKVPTQKAPPGPEYSYGVERPAPKAAVPPNC